MEFIVCVRLKVVSTVFQIDVSQGIHIHRFGVGCTPRRSMYANTVGDVYNRPKPNLL